MDNAERALSIIDACELTVYRYILASALADTMAARCEDLEIELCMELGLPYIDTPGERCLDRSEVDDETSERFYAKLLPIQRAEFPGYEDQSGNPHLIEESRVQDLERELIELSAPFLGWTFNQLIQFEYDEKTGEALRRRNGKLKMKKHTVCDLICSMVLNKETL